MANPATKINCSATGVARLPASPKILRSVREEDPVSMDNPPLGSVLCNHYRIDRELGRAGMATVYLTYDLKHDRPVALKVLHANIAAMLGPERFFARSSLPPCFSIPTSCRSSIRERQRVSSGTPCRSSRGKACAIS